MTYDLNNLPDWFEREKARFDAGEYQPVPWPENLTQYPGHFLHLSETTPGNVAFTQSSAHGERDRQTTIKPGKYLTKYFPDLPPPEVARLAGLISATTKSSELFIARTREEIAHVYKNGPNSCMSERFRSLECHPSEVYAGPDTAVAYIKGTGDRIVGRAVIRTSVPRGYMRLYGDDVRLLASLTAEGYGEAVSFEGCRLLRINREESDYIIAPYVDGGDSACARYSPTEAILCNQYLTLSDDGDVELTSTGGYVDCRTYECSECQCSVDPDACYLVNDERYCEFCYSECFVTDYDGETIPRDEATEVFYRYGTTYVHDNELDSNTARCFLTNELWLSGDLVVIEPDGELASPDALNDDANYQFCDLTRQWYHVDNMVQFDGIWIHKSKEDEVCRPDRPLIKIFPDQRSSISYLEANQISWTDYRYRVTSRGQYVLTFQYATAA